jgi:hypothetical protein
MDLSSTYVAAIALHPPTMPRLTEEDHEDHVFPADISNSLNERLLFAVPKSKHRPDPYALTPHADDPAQRVDFTRHVWTSSRGPTSISTATTD